ncbi:YeiH family protein [Ottowia flava]|uniref:YeiH family protein n=1 Tax=Ottowia flava TaxID=2675430 RepID=A0ABW4KSE0_9BURK
MSASTAPATSQPLLAAQTPRTPSLWPGLALAGALAAVAIWLSRYPWFQSHGLSALTLAIVLGMVVGNTVYPRIAAQAHTGVGFAKSTLLRAGIVLYGLRLTFTDIAQVGWPGVLIDVLMLGSTFVGAYWVGTRLFKMDRQTVLLIGAGSSVCGAAAVLATEPVVKARAEQVAVAVATVVVFGTLAMFLWPTLYALATQSGWLQMDAHQYGIFVGSTVHEVAQVVVAGASEGEAAANAAVIAKMVRVMMLAPLLIALSWWLAAPSAGAGSTTSGEPSRVVIPWFAVGFIAVTAFNTIVPLPAHWIVVGRWVDDALLATAMASLGLTTHLQLIRKAGAKPLLLAAMLFGWLLGGGLLVNVAVHWLMG